MGVLALSCGALLLLGIWFICAPLLRSEENLEPLYESRPAVQASRGQTDGLDVEYSPLPETGKVRCYRCGAVCADSYQYCGSCLEPLPTHAP